MCHRSYQFMDCGVPKVASSEWAEEMSREMLEYVSALCGVTDLKLYLGEVPSKSNIHTFPLKCSSSDEQNTFFLFG